MAIVPAEGQELAVGGVYGLVGAPVVDAGGFSPGKMASVQASGFFMCRAAFCRVWQTLIPGCRVLGAEQTVRSLVLLDGREAAHRRVEAVVLAVVIALADLS